MWAINNAPMGQNVDVHNSYCRGAELPYTWAELQAKIQAGDFSNLYIGDYKQITLTTGEVVIMELASVSQYRNHGDTAIGYHLDFISRDCLSGNKRFNPTNNNNGTADEKNPWLASELYKTLNDESSGVYATLPADLKPYIITKRANCEERYSTAGAVTRNIGWFWKNMGKLWLPTEVEVFGHHTWSEPGYGTSGGGCDLQYPIFRLNGFIKGDGNGGSRCNWWEASAARTDSTHFCNVSGNGDATHDTAAHPYIYVPLCFRIGISS